MKKPINRGRFYSRTAHGHPFDPERVNMEKAFADAWEHENTPCRGIDYGYGILQNLFCDRGLFGRVKLTHRISRRERMIAATVIQWLGSNCGRCWLASVLHKAGYRLCRIGEQ